MFGIVFPLIIGAIFTIIIVMSLGYSYEAKLFPLIIAIPAAALVAAQILIETRSRSEPGGVALEEKVTWKDLFNQYLTVLAWIVALLLIVYLTGLAAGLPLFTFLYLKLHRQSWVLSIILALAILAIVYGGFAVGFKMPLYGGLLFR